MRIRFTQTHVFLISVFFQSALVCHAVDEDRRLTMFDKANEVWLANRRDVLTFIAIKNPRLKEYAERIVLPYDESCAAVRKYFFCKKLKQEPPQIEWKKGVRFWALTTPFHDEIVALAGHDPSFSQTYNKYEQSRDTYRRYTSEHKEIRTLYNEAVEKYRRELYDIEMNGVKELQRIENTLGNAKGN